MLNRKSSHLVTLPLLSTANKEARLRSLKLSSKVCLSPSKKRHLTAVVVKRHQIIQLNVIKSDNGCHLALSNQSQPLQVTFMIWTPEREIEGLHCCIFVSFAFFVFFLRCQLNDDRTGIISLPPLTYLQESKKQFCSCSNNNNNNNNDDKNVLFCI